MKTIRSLDELNKYVIESKAGVAFDFYGKTAPDGSLPCNGQLVSIKDYPVLYIAIGDEWATTDGAATPTAGTFRLPPQKSDGLGLFNRGVGVTNGGVGTYQVDVFKSHNHNVLGCTSSGTGGGLYVDTANNNKDTGNDMLTVTSGDTTETRPRSLTVLKCIYTGK